MHTDDTGPNDPQNSAGHSEVPLSPEERIDRYLQLACDYLDESLHNDELIAICMEKVEQFRKTSLSTAIKAGEYLTKAKQIADENGWGWTPIRERVLPGKERDCQVCAQLYAGREELEPHRQRKQRQKKRDLTKAEALGILQGKEPKPVTEDEQKRKDVENASKKLHLQTCGFTDANKWPPEQTDMIHLPFTRTHLGLYLKWKKHQHCAVMELKRDVRLEQQRRKRLEGFPTLFTDEELDNFERASTRLSIDSGAHGLFNKHVPKGTRDYSYYDLSKGTKFRQYCDSYAAFMKELRGSGIWCVNVDAIYHPELTWQIQKFFENEHGITPVPVVHCDTPMRDVDRYLEAGQYPLLGVGGLGQGITIQKFRPWADKLFAHIPKEIKTHGFAMTSPELLFRYRWTSVDSATWVKKSAYGWLHIPVFSEKDGWLFDDPMEVNVSDTPPKGAEKKHYKNIPKEVQRMVDQWLHHIGLNIQLVASHHRKRSIANLIYLSELGESAGVKMFFSGGGGLNDTPEALIPERNPHVMLTFHNIHQENSDTVERLSKYVERKEEWRRSGEHPLPC